MEPSYSLSLVDQIHTQALEISRRYQQAEGELLSILQRAEDHRVYIKRGHSSLFQYVVQELGLGESAAYGLITVARKSREVPELKSKVESGEITLSNARRVAVVLTPENQTEWIQKATELSNRQLEKEIVKIRPKESVQERAAYVTPNRVRLELGLSEHDMLQLRRVQDLLSQARKSPATLEETIQALTLDYLRRHDPVERAKRHRVKKGSVSESEPITKSSTASNPITEENLPLEITPTPTPTPTPEVKRPSKNLPSSESDSVGKHLTLRVPPKRVAIPAAILHQVNFRDQRRCTHPLPNGARCGQSRWIEIHHKIPVSEGGANTIENLTTLCSAHHKFEHL